MPDSFVSPAIITEFFRIGLVSRTVSIDAIDAWATSIIAKESSPSIELCDLASAKHTDRAIVIDALRSYERTDDDLDELPECIFMPISIIEVDYSLARDQVFGSVEEVEIKFLRLLETFFDEETPKYILG